MKRRSELIFFTAVLAVGVFPRGSACAAQSCQDLANLKLPQTTITEAKTVPAGPFSLPGQFGPRARQIYLPAFCRVKGVIKPTSDSDIRFEVWMPAKNWNGKFEGTGNGVFAGYIDFGGLAAALQAGFAAASTDTGHAGGALDARWAKGHPQKVIDFGYRAIHLTAVMGKKIVKRYYASAPRWSYFASCSTGGRQALMEAQRFPDDYNGIIAGDPANYMTHLVASAVWDSQAVYDNPASFISSSKIDLLGKSVLAACDAADGVKDGIVNDPTQCHFNPKTLLCKGADSNDCLTAPQVTAVEKIYSGPSNSKGQNLFPGFSPGSEAGFGGWGLWIVGSAPDRSIDYSIGNQFFSNFVFDNPSWNFRTFNFGADLALTDKKLASIMNATNPNLRRFKAHGGKLILYHGWADSAIPPLNTVNYYQSVVSDLGESQTQKFVRLYMVPGMQHCGGGSGPDSFGSGPSAISDPDHSIFDSMEQWAEHGVAPKAIIATKYANPFQAAGAVLMTRPLCPFPEVATYQGKGDTNDASNFVCKTK